MGTGGISGPLEDFDDGSGVGSRLVSRRDGHPGSEVINNSDGPLIIQVNVNVGWHDSYLYLNKTTLILYS